MAYTISIIPYGQISYVIPALTDSLRKSEVWTKSRACVDDIVKFVLTGQMQLWLIFDPETNATPGYFITEVKQYPQVKMLVVQYCAAEIGMLNEVFEDSMNILERFAKDAECIGIEFFGRPGWGPHAKKHGYMTKTVVYEKYFSGV
jgi:hypothetical protein